MGLELTENIEQEPGRQGEERSKVHEYINFGSRKGQERRRKDSLSKQIKLYSLLEEQSQLINKLF